MDDPEERPVPGRLGLVRDFVNTLDYPTGPDELDGPAAATRWFSDRGIDCGSALSEADCASLRQLRERLRDVLEGNAGHDVSAQARQDLGRALAGVALSVQPARGGFELVPAERGAGAAVAELSAAVVEATIAGTWGRLKVCASDSCRFAFYDHSKNGSGAWCSMRVCGSRAKARAYRERRRSGSPQ